MSDQIKHECGIALIRLLKPLDYYVEKYGSAFWGVNKMFLLMQKQINRGQDGCGIATVKLDTQPGHRYLSRKRNISANPVKDMFNDIYVRINKGLAKAPHKGDVEWLKENVPYCGEVLMGHLRYGTHGENSLEKCHPFLRQNNWKSRTLLLSGNFNLTNVDELFNQLIELGQSPKEVADTVIMLEKIGHFQDREVQRQFERLKKEGFENKEISEIIANELDIRSILERSVKKADGGYALCGIMGHGDAFVMRDAKGIRPAYYYHDDEVVVVASERPPIQTVFNILFKDIRELPPGHAIIIKKSGQVSIEQFATPSPEKEACSFERIYFSRGNDRNIYLERKKLGELLAERVLSKVNYDFENTVFSNIPNTSETAYLGMVNGIELALNRFKKDKINELMSNGNSIDQVSLEQVLNIRPRFEKLILKDVKMRTFIAEDSSRDELVSHVYDVTYGIIKDHKDTLVLLDDSIVRGTTLQQSILRMAERLKPKKIIIVSSAPQIRYPDCYGIDMSKLKEFVAFQAMLRLLEENGLSHKLQEAYERSKASLDMPAEEIVNEVKPLYDLFTYEELTKKIADIVRPEGFQPELELVYQSLEGLHKACPNNKGDWYFSGKYPTPGGYKVANRAFVYFMEGKNLRAY